MAKKTSSSVKSKSPSPSREESVKLDSKKNNNENIKKHTKKHNKNNTKEVADDSSSSSNESIDSDVNVYSMDYDSIGDLDYVKEGPVRPYLSVDVPKSLSSLRQPSTYKEYIGLGVLLLVTCVYRLYGLSYPDSVVFDEVHFGKFAAKYIRGQYFFDVHPPLAKMLFAGIGSLAGFKGNFEFEEIGMFFPKDTPYYILRLFSALCGVLTCIFMYLTLRCSGVKPWICLLSTMLFIIENSFITISRYILLDAPLILFISGAAYFYKKYEIYPENSFKSFKALVFTGTCLGLALSSKWVGLFTIAWIGVLCLLKLWVYIGDMSKPLCITTGIASKWGSILLGIPTIIYLLSFNVHFNTLIHDSEGSALLSPAYRATLQGNHIPKDIIAPVGFGSVVSIRHINSNGGYLHSHDIAYTEGSQQQQITLYPHIDGNNDWLVEDYNNTNVENYETFENLKHGTKIRLKHVRTLKRLHSHDHKPPVSFQADWQKEASGYGFDNFGGDPNDDFIIEIDEKLSTKGEAQKIVKAIDTKFRLRHAMTGCLLFSHNVNLPDGGQQEVTCAHSGIPALTVWYIEQNTHPLLEHDSSVERVSYPVFGFWQKFLESNKKMWSVNNGFTDTHIYQSDPTTWPLLTRGIAYWGKDNRSVYLLGNAITWWLSSATVAIFGGIVLFELVKWQLGYGFNTDKAVLNFHIQITHYLLGWFIHYFPFFIMGRQLFLHHYLPAYYFLIMAFAHLLDLLVSHIFSRRRIIGLSICVALLSSAYYFFDGHKNFAYGTPTLKNSCEKHKWLSGWDYPCDMFLESWDEYSNYTLSTPEPKQTSFQATSFEELFKEDADGNKRFDPKLAVEQDKRIANGNNAGPVEVDIEEVKQNHGSKKFIGADGQEIDEALAMKIIEEQGGRIMKVEETVRHAGTPDAPHQQAPPPPPKPVTDNLNVGVQDVMNDKGPKVFYDQYGNELPQDVALSLLNEGGRIVNVEKSSTYV